MGIAEYAADPILTAYHEAGHAVMAWLSHYDDIELLPCGPGVAGKCVYSPVIIWGASEAAQAAAIAAAGGVAQRKKADPDDWENNCWEDLTNGLAGCDDDMGKIAGYLPAFPNVAGPDDLLGRLLPIVCANIDRHWGKVEALALAYLENGSVLSVAATSNILPDCPFSEVAEFRAALSLAAMA